MSPTLTIRIADIPVQLKLDCAEATRTRIAEYYAAFVIPDSTDAFKVDIREESGSPYIPHDGSSTWQVRTQSVNGRIDFESHYERGWADRAAMRGELVLRARGDPENYLRVLYAWLCLDQSGVLLHASGVISKDKGFVFFGHSGSGKTTVSRLSLDRTVLSDDLVIIKESASGKFWLYGVPFRGDFAEGPRVNANAELAAVFALVKDQEHRVDPLPLPEAIARLAACVPFVMAQPTQSARVVEICTRLVTSVPVRALHFARDPGFWKVIDGCE
jgi:hypothetical protein